MKKFLVLLALAASASAMASTKSTGPGDIRSSTMTTDARACSILLRRMARSPGADTWRNRMRAWTCRQQVKGDGQPMLEARR